MTVYRLAPEVETIAAKVIKKHRPELLHIRIVYLFVEKAPTSMGRTVWGRARRIAGLAAVLTNLDDYAVKACAQPDPFYVLEISEDIWQHLDPKRREALVDHELMHLKPETNDDGDRVLKMRGHDFEEFAAIIRRHGLWTTAATTIGAEVVEQLALAVDDTISIITGDPAGDEVDGDADG